MGIPRQAAVRSGLFAIPPLAVFAVGAWVISPRFSITGPSLIDDWDALLSTPAAVNALRFAYHLDQARFRPGWVAWNWVQWRVPGAPGNMLGPNLLGVTRLALLVAGMTSLTWLVIPRERRSRVELALLSALPALIVLTLPAFAEDLARFGPEEPALVGGVMLGGSLLYRGGRQLAAAGSRTAIRGYVLTTAGFLTWCFGVFQKETSVCVLLVLLLAFPLGRNLRRDLSTPEIRVGAILGAIAALPVFGVLVAVIGIVRSGSLVYGQHVKTGSSAIAVFGDAVRAMHSEMHSRWGFLLFVIVVAAIAVSLWQRRPDWVQVTILLLAVASLEFSAQTEVFTSRYYLPSIALLAVGAARAVGRLPPGYARGAIVAAWVVTAFSAGGAHSNVTSWASGDQIGDDLVNAVRMDTHRGCHLKIDGIDPERTAAIAGLVAYPSGYAECAGVPRYVLIGPSPERSGDAECAPLPPIELGEWRVGNAEPIQFLRCGPG
jgi:hypothetical protein